MTEAASGGTLLLPRAVVLALKEHTEDAYVSPVSIWEMAIEHRIGKLAVPTEDVESAIAAQGFGWLAVQPSHAQAVFALPAHHRDPFDLLLIAQAMAEDICIVTSDPIFARYLPDTIILGKSLV